MSTAAVSIVSGQNLPQRGSKIQWEEPPTESQIHGAYHAFAAELRKRPMAWAVLKSFPREHARRAWAMSSNINSGKKSRDWRPGEFEATARTVGDVVKVYVRYVGPAQIGASS
jgi:hypothetical protein